MPWTTAKTDWAIQPRDQYGRYNGDWFNWQDYERIRENIEYLAETYYAPIAAMQSIDQAVMAYPGYTGYTSGAAITDAMRYAAPVMVNLQINPIERNLDILADSIYRPDGYPATKTWAANGKTPTVADLNRYENCLLQIYNVMKNSAAYRLAIRLGTKRGDVK